MLKMLKTMKISFLPKETTRIPLLNFAQLSSYELHLRLECRYTGGSEAWAEDQLTARIRRELATISAQYCKIPPKPKVQGMCKYKKSGYNSGYYSGGHAALLNLRDMKG